MCVHERVYYFLNHEILRLLSNKRDIFMGCYYLREVSKGLSSKDKKYLSRQVKYTCTLYCLRYDKNTYGRFDHVAIRVKSP